MKKQSRMNRSKVLLSAIVLPVSQILSCAASASTESLQYEGTTEMTTKPVTLDIVTSAAELIVEEVYVKSGDTVASGDQILKLSEESYQEAMNYYDASIIRADRSLTDTRRSYDQGILEIQYEYEKAKTEAEQAEFIKDYQSEEVTNAIEDHQEMITELEERIQEIEAGNYGSSSGSGGGSASSGSSKSKSSNNNSNTKNKKNKKTSESETETSESSGSETETPESGGSEQETPGSNGSLPETPESGGSETETPESGGSETETPESIGAETEAPEKDGEQNLEEQIVQLKEEINNRIQAQKTILEQLQPMLENQKQGNHNAQEGSGEQGEQNSGSENTVSSVNEELSTLEEKLQSSIDGDVLITGHMNNVKAMADEKLTPLKAVAEAAGIKYNDYYNLLNECIALIESDVKIQQEVQTALSSLSAAKEPASSSEDTSVKTSGDDTSGEDTGILSELMTQFIQTNEELLSLYSSLVSLEEEQISSCQTNNNDLQNKISELNQKIEALEAANSESETAPGRPGETNSGTGEVNSDSQTMPGVPSDMQNPDSSTNGANSMPSITNNGSMPSMTNSEGMPSFSSGGGAAMGSFSGSGTMILTGGNAMSMEDLNLTETDISLLGNTYDLSQYESILEREPSDSDAAEEYLDTLRTALRTVTKQYNELLRNQPLNELKIQYNYDSLKLQGQLAELTYEQDMQELTDTLKEADEKKEDLIKQKEKLEAFTDGIIFAGESGVIAEVGYEAEDVLSSKTPLIYYYNMDQLQITLAVSQEQISSIQVGDTADVTIADFFHTDGTIIEKAAEAQEGNSRTTVQYEVIVGVDNGSGTLSSGMAARVSLDQDQAESKEEKNE